MYLIYFGLVPSLFHSGSICTLISTFMELDVSLCYEHALSLTSYWRTITKKQTNKKN